jgi:hypothetical protein
MAMTKKILITGMNAAQCKRDYFLGQEIKVVPSHYALIRCLTDLGYEVEQRAVNIGESLDQYDEVIVYLHSIQAFCQRLWGGLYAISARPNAILAFDDWQVNQIYDSFRNYAEDLRDSPEKAFREYLFDLYQGKESRDVVIAHRNAYLQAVDIVMAKNNRLLISAFAGGNVDLLNLDWQKSSVFTFNPNPYHLNRTPSNNYGEPMNIMSFVEEDVQPEDKIRAWNFASLVQNKTGKWLKAQNPQSWGWPINYYGQRRGENKQERLIESEMCKVYNRMWGCLMPGYFHSGSGWWRARPLQVADAGSILVCDDKEGHVYGEAYVSVKAAHVEQMDMTQLTSLALRQRECLYDKHPLNKQVTRNELMKALEFK